MNMYVATLIVILCDVLLLLLPWMIVWLTFWWPRWRYRNTPEETCLARAVYLHDAMPYLRGHMVEPMLPYSLYYVTFKAEGQRPMKFRVSQEDYYRIGQGDEGRLKYRGKMFVGFCVQSES